jgi:hypothetical protein
VELPVDSLEESHLVRIDLLSLQTGDSAPRARRVVAILEILRSQDERSEEHAPTALQSAA